MPSPPSRRHIRRPCAAGTTRNRFAVGVAVEHGAIDVDESKGEEPLDLSGVAREIFLIEIKHLLVFLNVAAKTKLCQPLKWLRCQKPPPGVTDLDGGLEGFEVQGEEDLLQDVGHIFGAELVEDNVLVGHGDW